MKIHFISIEIGNTDQTKEKELMQLFNGKLGLEKKKEKIKKGRRVAVDLGNFENQEIKCNAHNLGKISALKQPEFTSIMEKLGPTPKMVNYLGGSLPRAACITHSVSLLTRNVYLCGRYIRFSRYLSQTPWVIDGRKLTEGSLQE